MTVQCLLFLGDLLITYIPLGAMLRPMRKVTSASAVTLGIPPEHELIGELLIKLDQLLVASYNLRKF